MVKKIEIVLKNKDFWQKIILFTLLYFIVSAANGYYFGDGSHAEDMAYVKFLLNKNLYQNDFYIQFISDHVPNERYFFAKFLSFLGENHLEVGVFVFHFLATLSLFFGIFSISSRFIQNKTLNYFCVLSLYLIFIRFSFGGNELYNNQLISINAASAFGIWALYFFLEKKYYHFAIFAIIATFFHSVGGLQLFLLCFLSECYFVFLNKKTFLQAKNFYLASFLYILLTFTWLFLLLNHFSEGNISSQEVFEIVSFRAPHHFIPSLFRWYNHAVMLPLLAFGFYFFYQKEKIISAIFLVCFLGLVPYIVATDFFHSPIFFFTQWCRATTWLKLLSVIAIFSFFEEKYLKSSFLEKIFKRNLILYFVYFSLFFISISQIFSPVKIFSQTYHFPFFDYKKENDIEISLKIKEITSQNALFVQAGTISCLKYFGERSSYFDLMTGVHSKKGFKEFYERAKTVYHFELKTRNFKKSIFSDADDHFFLLKENDFLDFQKKGATHILTKNTHQLSFPILYENEEWRVYEIK